MVSEYIGLDQALAALVLQLANSAFLGYNRTCTSINEAVMRLGFKRMKSILLASAASAQLNQRLRGYRQGAGDLWQHSLMTAVSAEWLAQALRYKDAEEAYVSGLLHDLGKLLLDQYVLTDYSKMVDLMEKYQYPLWVVEEKLIGINHAQVGGLIAEKWAFPVTLVDTIRHHHAPSLARTNQNLPAIINLANHIAGRIKQAPSALFSTELHPETVNILKVTEADVERFSELIQQKVQGSG
jgi:putative nucleotidyltransferase with HDIG domain